MNIVAIAFRNVGRNKRRTALSVTAIAIAAMVIVFMFAIIDGLKVDILNNIFHMVTGQVRMRNARFDENEIRNPLDLGISDADGVLRLLEAQPSIQSLSPRIMFPTALYREGKNYRGMGLGVDFGREEGFQGLSRSLVQGSMPSSGARETALSSGLARDMGVGVGDKITLYTKNASGGMNGMTLRITGIFVFSVPSFNKSLFLLPLDTAQRLLGMKGSVVEILVLLRDGTDVESAAASISRALLEADRGELSVKPWTTIGIWFTYLRLADAIYTIFALVFVLLGTTVVINTTMMVIYERVREIGMMSALGMPGASIVALFFLESLFIGIMGALAGTIAGIAITLPLASTGIDMSQTMRGVDFQMSAIFKPVLNLKSTSLAFLYAAAVSSFVSIFPSRRASRVEPVKALRAL
jgi:putative ABC transport system permease protein